MLIWNTRVVKFESEKKLSTKKITKTYLLPEHWFCYLLSLPVAKVCYPPKKLISSPVVISIYGPFSKKITSNGKEICPNY